MRFLRGIGCSHVYLNSSKSIIYHSPEKRPSARRGSPVDEPSYLSAVTCAAYSQSDRFLQSVTAVFSSFPLASLWVQDLCQCGRPPPNLAESKTMTTIGGSMGKFLRKTDLTTAAEARSSSVPSSQSFKRLK